VRNRGRLLVRWLDNIEQDTYILSIKGWKTIWWIGAYWRWSRPKFGLLCQRRRSEDVVAFVFVNENE
jgi:hypothetical protein